MTYHFIDLSVHMEENPGELAPYGFEQTGHKEGADRFARQFDGSRKDFPGEEFLNMEMITASTHTGTHFDAPLHFGSMSEGKPAASIDQVPLEWCYGDGVVLDVTHIQAGEAIEQPDIEQALERIGYKLKPLDIVLIRTGADRHWGTPRYLTDYPGMSREATQYLTGQGIKVMGIDSYGFDRPFKNMIGDYKRTGDNAYLFPAHFWGREQTYCHMERLANLEQIPVPYGFKVACFPVKIRAAGAAWVRAVAIVE
ncbi:cyclase family protein [Paenibacillus tritici]|uniref:cyclase family protein n=1 Tax=Paenibacillus tritici TaxID=1873425 RepID=UPI001BA4FA70|nr:cyclase family protein [Paenibacillus tritici]QUL56047.1 cyclase family protein [Paenibacillus tritici]